MVEQSIWDYLHYLKFDKRVWLNKQEKFLSHIAIYTNELNVYKVILFADPNKLNGKRVGVNKMITIYTHDYNPKNIIYPKLKNELDGSEKGTKIFMYTFRTADLSCFDGEQLTV